VFVKFQAVENEFTQFVSESIYSKTDYSLEVALQSRDNDIGLSHTIDKIIAIPQRSSFVFFDNLTLEFSSPYSMLKSLEAYINHEKWSLAPLVIPHFENKKYSLMIIGNPAEERISINKLATYHFDEKQSCLNIKLETGVNEQYYRLSDDLIVGLSDNNLSSFYILNLKIKDR